MTGEHLIFWYGDWHIGHLADFGREGQGWANRDGVWICRPEEASPALPLPVVPLDPFALLGEVVDAWEALPGGQQAVWRVEEWLATDLAPAIDKAREALGRKRPS